MSHGELIQNTSLYQLASTVLFHLFTKNIIFCKQIKLFQKHVWKKITSKTHQLNFFLLEALCDFFKDKRREVRVFHMRKEDLNSVCQKLGIKYLLRSCIFVKCVFQNQQKVLAYVCKLRRLYFLTWPWKWGFPRFFVQNCPRGICMCVL